MIIYTNVTVTYAYTVEGYDEAAIYLYAEQHNISLEQAVQELFDRDEICLYPRNDIEEDCSEETVVEVVKEENEIDTCLLDDFEEDE